MQFQIHCAGSFTCELRCVAVARGMLRRFRRNNRLPQDTAMQRIRYERVFKLFRVGKQFLVITALLLSTTTLIFTHATLC